MTNSPGTVTTASIRYNFRFMLDPARPNPRLIKTMIAFARRLLAEPFAHTLSAASHKELRALIEQKDMQCETHVTCPVKNGTFAFHVVSKLNELDAEIEAVDPIPTIVIASPPADYNEPFYIAGHSVADNVMVRLSLIDAAQYATIDTELINDAPERTANTPFSEFQTLPGSAAYVWVSPGAGMPSAETLVTMLLYAGSVLMRRWDIAKAQAKEGALHYHTPAVATL